MVLTVQRSGTNKNKKMEIRVEERKIRKEEKVSVHGKKIHALLEKFI